MKIIIHFDVEKEKEKICAEFSPEWQSRLVSIYELLENNQYEAAREAWLKLPDPSDIDDWEKGRSFIAKDLRLIFENFEWVETENDNPFGKFFRRLEENKEEYLKEMRKVDWENPSNSFFNPDALEKCKISEEEAQTFREKGKRVDFPDIDGGFSVYTLEDGRTFVEDKK